MDNENLYTDSDGVEYIAVDCPEANRNYPGSNRCNDCAFQPVSRTDDCLRCQCSAMRGDRRDVIWVPADPVPVPVDPNPL